MMGSVFRQAGRHTWMIKYYRDGRPVVESSHTDNKRKAGKLLNQREADVDRGVPVSAKVGRVRFEDAATDLIRDYRTNGRRSLSDVARRVTLHLTPFFAGRRLSTVDTADVRRYIDRRQEEGAANATINRELAAFKRMYSLAVQGGRLLFRPHIPLLEESNVRAGFFERDQFEAVRGHLPEDLRTVVLFAYVTGWRIQSEVLPLEWRQVDLAAGTVRLDPGTTKNAEGRTFPVSAAPELHEALEGENGRRAALEQAGVICPFVFQRAGRSFLGEDGHASHGFRVAWREACRRAGCPGRIPHDFRRTAVRNLVRAGVPEKTAMMLTGHKTRSVFDRYDVVNEADLRDAVSRLSESRYPRSERRANRRRS